MRQRGDFPVWLNILFWREGLFVLSYEADCLGTGAQSCVEPALGSKNCLLTSVVAISGSKIAFRDERRFNPRR
jgi:hypothetical protein